MKKFILIGRIPNHDNQISVIEAKTVGQAINKFVKEMGGLYGGGKGEPKRLLAAAVDFAIEIDGGYVIHDM